MRTGKYCFTKKHWQNNERRVVYYASLCCDKLTVYRLFLFYLQQHFDMSCDEPVALFMRESNIVRDSFGNCGHVGYLTIAC